MVGTKLNPIQLELLKVYSFQHSEEDLLAIKKLLAEYFAKKLVKEVDEAVKRNNITEEDLDRWLNEE
ncbi:MAG: hypothetical protein ACKV1O_14135 [Saprospiraceae bacterium]